MSYQRKPGESERAYFIRLSEGVKSLSYSESQKVEPLFAEYHEGRLSIAELGDRLVALFAA